MTIQVLLQNRQPNRIATLEEYCASGGYDALSSALGKYTRHQVQQLALDAVLLGRGGAGFPAGRKLMTVAETAPFPRYMVCNVDEMEPGTFKDRVLIHTDPHQIIEGMIIVGYSVLAEKGIICIRSSYENAARILEREIARAKEAGFLGKNILGSDFSMDIVVHRSAGRYICGENTTQINAIEGKRANPMQPPLYATEKGIWGFGNTQFGNPGLCAAHPAPWPGMVQKPCQHSCRSRHQTLLRERPGEPARVPLSCPWEPG